MTSAQNIVNKLDDSQAVMMLKLVHDRIFDAVDFEVIEKGTKGNVIGENLLEVTDLPIDAEFDSATSIKQARVFLNSIAKDDDLSDLITESWQELQKNDQMFVGATIAVGLMVNLTLFMVSSKIELKIGNLTIKKDKVDTAAVKAIMQPVTEILKKIKIGVD